MTFLVIFTEQAFHKLGIGLLANLDKELKVKTNEFGNQEIKSESKELTLQENTNEKEAAPSVMETEETENAKNVDKVNTDSVDEVDTPAETMLITEMKSTDNKDIVENVPVEESSKDDIEKDETNFKGTEQNPENIEQIESLARSSGSNSSIQNDYRKLASVTEETEEELQRAEQDDHLGKRNKENKVSTEAEDGKTKDKSSERLKSQELSRSDESVPSGGNVVRLRPARIKKERPLSDNFDNLKRIEQEGFMANNLQLQASVQESSSDPANLDKRKSKSLDTLLVEVLRRESSRTSSQNSLSETHGSSESLSMSADELDGQTQIFRTRSLGSATLEMQRRAQSQLSLNDVNVSLSTEDVRPETYKKKKYRFNFKKAKSTTALEMKEMKQKEMEGKFFVLFCFVLFCFVLFCFVLFCFVLVWFVLVWFGLVWFGLVWFGLVWFGLVWFGLFWFGLVWFGLV